MSNSSLKAVFAGLARQERGRGALCFQAMGENSGALATKSSSDEKLEHLKVERSIPRLIASTARPRFPSRAVMGLGLPLTCQPHASHASANPSAASTPSGIPAKSCTVVQVRHFSWRRYVPSMHDFRNAAEAPDRQVTNLLIALNTATYLSTWFDRGVAVSMAMIPYQVARGEWYRLLTCGFLHMDFLHVLANMLSLHWMGPPVESAAGRGRFAAIYLASILGGSLAQYHFGSFAAASMGASGGVFGLFGAYLVFRFRNRSFISWDHGDSSWLMQVVGINVLLGLMAGGTIAQMAHLGGAVTGAAACWLIGPRYQWQHGRLVDRPLLPMFRSRD